MRPALSKMPLWRHPSPKRTFEFEGAEMRLKTLASIFLAALVGTTPSIAQQSGAARIAPRSVKGSTPYGQLPLTFEANRGQAVGQVKFLSRGKGYTAFLTAEGMVLTLHPSRSDATSKSGNSAANSQQPARATLQFHLLGASRNAVVVGEDQKPGKVNYFIGNDRTKWHTNVPIYTRVRYKNVYPGIDLIYYGHQQQLEYDFAVAPGADPSRIQFQIRGADQVRVDAAGNLVLTTNGKELHFQSPIIYQESGSARVPVEGGYVMKDSTHIAFQVAHYDSGKPLVIDPVLVYSTYLGGGGDDQPTGIAVDGNGSVYVTGYTDSTDFPLATLGSLPAGADHVFIAKFDATGSNLIYADYIGGNSQDYGYALVLDSANEVYVTGGTASSDFPVVNAYQSTYPGAFNAFLTKVSSDGASLLYSTYLGGNGSDVPTSVRIDNLSNVLVAGSTSSTNFPVANAYQSTASPNQGGLYGNYGFLTKFTPDGSALVYSTYLGGSSNVPDNCSGTPCWTEPVSGVNGMVLDSAGNAYLAGTTNTYDFPVTSGAYLTTDSTPQNSSVGFVSKISSSGNLQYSTYFYESSGFTNINAIAVDATGSAYVTGLTYSNGTFPITSTSICDPGVYGVACSYAFVTKFDATASTLAYSTFLGPNNYAVPAAIVLDQSNDAYVLTSTSSSSFSTVNGLEPYAGGNDALLVEIDPGAGSQLFATYLGGSADENATALAIDAENNLYVTGTTDSTDFPTTQQAFQTQSGGNSDGFVMKIGMSTAPLASLTPSTLQFASLPVGSTSAAQQVVLRNMGNSALAIASISAAGDFAETDNCGTSVPATGSCTLSVTFTPTAAGQRTGSVAINDDAAGSPHIVSLSGTGLGAIAGLSPAALVFSSVPVHASSPAQTVTLSNQGNSSLSIATVQTTGDFAQTNNCPAVLPSNSGCTINVVFTPTSSGTRSGTLTVSNSAQGSAQTVSLTGSGSDFALASSMNDATVKAGATATYELTISPVGGSFSKAVSLNCSGLPANAICTFSPSKVTPGTKSTAVTLTISTVSSTADAIPALPSPNHPVTTAWIQLQGLGLFGMVLAGCRKRSKRATIFIALALLVLGMLFMSGCAGGTGIASQSGSGSGTAYTVTVTGTSGALQHSLPLTLTVQ
jgi:hypothetical protein